MNGFYGRRKSENMPSRAQETRLYIPPKKYRKTTAVVSARLPEDMIEALDLVAKSTGYNRNEIIQKCLEFAIEHMDGRKS